MIEGFGSGSTPLINGSGSGSRAQKHTDPTDADPQYLLIFKGVFTPNDIFFFQRTEEAAVDNAMGDQDSSDEEQVRQ